MGTHKEINVRNMRLEWRRIFKRFLINMTWGEESV
jgi:hypothetical protein